LDAKSKREWLGTSRYNAYQTGALNVDDLINPSDGYVRTVEDLKQAGIVSGRYQQEKKDRSNTGETRDRIDTADDVAKYLRHIETDAQRKETQEANRLAAVLDALESTGRRDDKEFRETLTELNNLRRKRAEQDRNAIHDHIAPVSGKITRAAEIKFENDLHKRLKPHTLQEGKDGLAFVTRIIDTYDIQTDKPLPKFISKGARASYTHTTNTVDIGRFVGVKHFVVHEIGHYIQDNNNFIQQRCREFFNSVTEGGELRSLKKDFPNDPFTKNEMYKTAKIPMPPYALKVYSDDGGKTFTREADEVFSVALERLQREPALFAREYPTFFNFVINTLKQAKVK